jgi:hypothetical protein
MQLIKTLPLGVALLILSTNSFANGVTENLLCTVSSDVDSDVGKLVYEMDEDGRVIDHLYSEKWVNNILVSREEIKLADLVGNGIVLHKKDKYITVRLYSHNFDEERGGVLYLDTLYNAVKGERKEYTIEISKNLKSEIEMTYNKQNFSKMKFIGKKVPVLGVVGIEKVNFSK